MTSILKRILSPDQRRWAARLRDGLYLGIARLVAGLLRALPLRLLLLIKGRLSSVRRLDYRLAEIWLYVDTSVEYSTRLHAVRKEPETVRWIEACVKPDEVVYDIGANVGVYSLVAAKATAGKAKVYAFEPSFETFAQLNRNILLNHCQGIVIPVYLALSDQTTIETLYYSSLASGEALHALGQPIDTKGAYFTPAIEQPVLSCRLDDVVRWWHMPNPDHIKLDIDGGEWRVLQGATEILANPRLKTVLIEIEPTRETAAQVRAFLEQYGFVLASSHVHGQRETDTTNCIFTRPAAVSSAPPATQPIQAGH